MATMQVASHASLRVLRFERPTALVVRLCRDLLFGATVISTIDPTVVGLLLSGHPQKGRPVGGDSHVGMSIRNLRK